MQNFKFLVDGETIFDAYPEYINNMIRACMSDFAGSTPPTGDYIETGMPYFNTVEGKLYRYMGEEIGWVDDLLNNKTISSLIAEIAASRYGLSSLDDRIAKIANQNSGNAFPTGQIGVWVGMPCYRKDLQAIYICTEYDPQGVNHKWTDITNLSPIFGILKDEVLAARGTARSLAARLDVALNHDGTLKGTAPAGEWWEPATPYNFTKTDTSVLELADEGDYTALFEDERAVLLHPSHNRAYVVSSAYDEETNKTSVTIDEEIGSDTQIQFGAPVGNSSKIIIPNATDTVYGLSRVTEQVRAFADIPIDENKVPTEKAVAYLMREFLNNNAFFSVGDFKISFRDQLDGFLLCNGAAISRTTYKALFDVIGTTFGSGNGSTEFNLPDLRNRFIQGANNNVGTVFSAGLPNIRGDFGSAHTRAAGSGNNGPNGAIYSSFTSSKVSTVSNTGPSANGIDASLDNPIYGNSDTVQPPAIALNVFIKY